MKIKILIVSTLYYPYEIGGAERSTRLIAKGYKNKGYNVEIFTTCDKDYEQYIDGILVHYVKLKHVFWRYNSPNVSTIKKLLWRVLEYYNFVNTNKIRRILKKSNPDIIHTNQIAGIGSQIWLQSKKLKIPIVHTARDYYLLCAKSGMYRNNHSCNKQCLLCKLYTSNFKHHSQYVDAFVGVSEHVKNIHLDSGYFKNSKINQSINNIFNTEIKSKSIGNKEFNHNSIKIGVLGVIRKTKGVVEAISNIEDPDIKIIVAGSQRNDSYGKLFSDLLQKKNIEYLGHVEAETFFDKIDFLLHPALWNEPFPRVLIEAFSYGIPVIASNNGGTKEAIIGKGTGFVYNNYLDLNEILNDIKTKSIEYNKLSKNCIKYSAKFTEDSIVSQYLNIINEIV